MIIIRDDVSQSIGITKDDPAYAKVLQAYRLGFTSGVQEIRFAEGVPWEFIAWLDQYFSRCENWKHRYWLDCDKSEPPILGEYKNPYYRRMNVNRSCRFCGHSGNLYGGEKGWQVYCGHCRSETEFYPTKDEARQAWNSPTEEQIAYLRKTTDVKNPF